MWLHTLVWIPVVAVSLCRTAALWKYYSEAPLRIYSALPPATTTGLVCTCGEWYRFPSSFYLPPETALGFLPSSFQGQLPQAFSQFGSRPESEAVLQPFNDRNREEKERYVSDPVTECQWMVDLASGDCASHFVSDDNDDSAARLEVGGRGALSPRGANHLDAASNAVCTVLARTGGGAGTRGVRQLRALPGHPAQQRQHPTMTKTDMFGTEHGQHALARSIQQQP